MDDVGPTIAQQLALDPFAQVIKSPSVKAGKGMVAIHTVQCDLYTRLWCPFEMMQAVNCRVKIVAASSQKYILELQETYQ